MWDGFSMLFILSTLMAVASFLAGSLPLSLSLSQRQLRFISALGAGVLVGTALIVIIPEGIDTLYSAGRDDDHHHKRSPSAHPFARDDHKEKKHGHNPHAWVGICLVLGFILLYLIDVIPSISKKGAYKPLHISLSNLDRGLHHSPSSALHSPHPDNNEQSPPQERSSATTIGLIIHAVADGIALGASSSTPSSSLSLIIFIAIMLHKAPAAFGLTSILLKQGLSTRLARAHLLVFSLAAPAGAFATWIAVNMIGRKRLGGEEGLAWATGCMLLFSGGTFLYVAMHSMQQITPDSHAHAHDEQVPSAGQWTDAEVQAHAQRTTGTTPMEIIVVVAGMLVPLLTQFGHAH